MALVIRKPVDLSSLGDEYEGVKLLFRSIPAKDLPELEEKQKDLGEETAKILPFFIDFLKQYFVEGTQGETKLTQDDIGDLEAEALIYCFQILTGQALDPKVENSSSNTSSTEQPPA